MQGCDASERAIERRAERALAATTLELATPDQGRRRSLPGQGQGIEHDALGIVCIEHRQSLTRTAGAVLREIDLPEIQPEA